MWGRGTPGETLQTLGLEWLAQHITVDVNLVGPDGLPCWLWNRPEDVTESGYARPYWSTKLGGDARRHRVHRLVGSRVFDLAGLQQQTKERLYVLHDCDRRLCCRPSHLHPGTHHQNQQEAATRNPKFRRGPDHHLAKLSARARENIRRARERGISVSSLAEKYGVNKNTIYALNRPLPAPSSLVIRFGDVTTRIQQFLSPPLASGLLALLKPLVMVRP